MKKYLNKIRIVIPVLILSGWLFNCGTEQEIQQDWSHVVRIAGHGLNVSRIDSIISRSTATHVFGIEVDNDITGRYESFLDPAEKLAAIRLMADKAHANNNRAFVYIAGLEIITAGADTTRHTFFKDHPDWVQRDITGRPAVFGGGTAFWVRAGDEDVWISPYATEWRSMYMQRVKEIAATGIDGIYVDIPYWMTHFEGWENTWASFDDYTLRAFRKKTGLDAKKDIKLGDFSDPGFLRWVNFRMETLTAFMAEINRTVKAVNPECKTIAEIYPGIDESAVRVGADVQQMYEVVDAIAHEYSEGAYMAADREPVDWFAYMAGMYTFRALARGKPSWMLSYSWDGEKNIDPAEALRNLFLAQIMSGTNPWDARGYVMSGSNNYQVRSQVYEWIAANQDHFYKPRQAINPIGVYFSPRTRNSFAAEFYKSYMGAMIMMLQAHQEFQIVLPQTLRFFKGKMLVLPDIRCLNLPEVELIEKLVRRGGKVIFTGESGDYDHARNKYGRNPLHRLFGITETTDKKDDQAGKDFIYYPNCPALQYYDEIQKNYNQYARSDTVAGALFAKLLGGFVADLRQKLAYTSMVEIAASPFMATQVAMVDNKIHIFLANFGGLQGGVNASQTAQKSIRITLKDNIRRNCYLLPYLGEVQEIESSSSGNGQVYIIPEIQKGAVVWFDTATGQSNNQ
jgi:hypothetical protein